MNEQDLQASLLEAIDIVVGSKMKQIDRSVSKVGVVMEDPRGYEAKVKVGDNVYTCTLYENLHSWIQKDDVVTIQDLYGDGRKHVISGKTGQLQTTPSLVLYDEEQDRLISGVDGVFDENENKITYGTIIQE